MQYSFEILSPSRFAFWHARSKILFCKLDCSREEQSFIAFNRLEHHPIFELSVKAHVKQSYSILNRLLFAPLDPKKASKPKTPKPVEPLTLTLGDFLRGRRLYLNAYDIPKTEAAIEKHLIECAATMRLAIKRIDQSGRAHEI